MEGEFNMFNLHFREYAFNMSIAQSPLHQRRTLHAQCPLHGLHMLNLHFSEEEFHMHHLHHHYQMIPTTVMESRYNFARKKSDFGRHVDRENLLTEDRKKNIKTLPEKNREKEIYNNPSANPKSAGLDVIADQINVTIQERIMSGIESCWNSSFPHYITLHLFHLSPTCYLSVSFSPSPSLYLFFTLPLSSLSLSLSFSSSFLTLSPSTATCESYAYVSSSAAFVLAF